MLFLFHFFADIFQPTLKSIFVIIGFLFSVLINAQILDINKPLFSDEPFFNEKFIRTNKVKSIQGARSSKKVKDIIRTKGLNFFYEFDVNGSLSKQMATFHNTTNLCKDTNLIEYSYTSNNLLKFTRKSDAYGFYSNRYFYDSQNRLIKQTYHREENVCSSKNNFQLGKEYEISADSFSYQKLSDEQVKKIFYNNYHKPYKEEISYYDNLGYLKETYSKFLIGNKKSKTTYEYDEKGRMIKMIHFSDLSKNSYSTEEYFYDNLDNILEIKIYENEKYITSKQFLYDKKTFLLTAQIIQDVPTEFIRIIQYQYTFYNGETTSLSFEEN